MSKKISRVINTNANDDATVDLSLRLAAIVLLLGFVLAYLLAPTVSINANAIHDQVTAIIDTMEVY